MTLIVPARTARIERAKRAAYESFEAFCRLMMPAAVPGQKVVWAWYHSAICDHMQALYDGRIRRLLIAIPPGHTKSTIISILYPCWVWLNSPWESFLCGSHSLKLATRLNVDRRRILDSPLYQELLQPQWQKEKGSWQKTVFKNTDGGQMLVTNTITPSALGEHVDQQILDDPAQNKWAYGPQLQQVNEQFGSTLQSRFRNQNEAKTCVVAQRLATLDLIGYLLENEPERWDYLCLPAEYDPEFSTPPTSIGFTDPRTVKGQILSPVRHPRESLEYIRHKHGSGVYQSQQLQRPKAAGYGNIFSTDWWQFWQPSAEHGGLPGRIEQYIGVVDSAFGEASSESDFTCVQVWGRIGRHAYLLDQIHDRITFTELMTRLLGPVIASKRSGGGLIERWQACTTWHIEQASNGGAIVSTLREHMPRTATIVSIDPRGDGSKLAKAVAVSPIVEGGYAHLPDPETHSWVPGLVEEGAQFGAGAPHDDRVDCVRMALSHFGARIGVGSYVPKREKPSSDFSAAASRWGAPGTMR